MTDRVVGRVGLYSTIAAAVALVLSPLLALSYFATVEGAPELERGTVSAWATPARDLVGALLTWASPERVYATYWLLFWALFPAVFLCARVVHARRPTSGRRAERWGWRMALVGYAFASLGPVVAAAMLITGSTSGALIDVLFLAVMLPAIALDAIGSTVLGVALLRSGYEPRTTAWLLAVVVPSMIVLPIVLGN